MDTSTLIAHYLAGTLITPTDDVDDLTQFQHKIRLYRQRLEIIVPATDFLTGLRSTLLDMDDLITTRIQILNSPSDSY